MVDANSTPGTEQTLISETVPVGKKWSMWQTTLTHRFESDARVLLNSGLVDGVRTGPANYNPFLMFGPPVPMVAGDVVEFKFRALLGEPINNIKASVVVTEEDA